MSVVLVNDIKFSDLSFKWPVNPVLGNTSSEIAGLVDKEGAWQFNGPLGTATISNVPARHPFLVRKNSVGAGDPRQNVEVEVTFTAPSSSSLDLEICARTDVSSTNGKGYCIRFIFGNMYVSKIVN